MADVFISYKKNDRATADQIARELANVGLSVWSDQAITPGMDFQREIERELHQARCVLVLWSQASIVSPWVMKEALYALEKDKLVPALIEQTVLPLPFAALTTFDLRTLGSARLVALIAERLGKRNKSAPVELAPQRNKGFAFISYVAEDAEHQRDLTGFLAQHGYGFWEYGGSKRRYDAHLFNEIEDRLRECALALIIVSNDWKKSKWAFREFYFCEEISKPYFLLSFAPMEATLAISGIPRIKMSDRIGGFKKLGEELKEAGLQ